MSDSIDAESESFSLDFESLEQEAVIKQSYQTDERGFFKINGVYTGPYPRTKTLSEVSKKNFPYEINEKTQLKDEGDFYSAPVPSPAEETNQKNTGYLVDTNGTYKDAGTYSGPIPYDDGINPNSKNNSNYEISENGAFKDVAGIYTGPVPNETEKAKAILQLYDAKEYEQDEKYIKLKKWQKNHLRHAGYKYKPKNMVLIDK